MDIVKHIRELLIETDCVILPDFGGFVANEKSATIHPVTHFFSPPSKQIAFNSQLKSNDGLLISVLSEELNIEMKQIKIEIEKFVKEIKEELKSNKEFLLNGIGKLFIKENDIIQFEPIEELFPTANAFGMTEFFAKPIEREDNIILRNKSKQTMSTPNRRPAGTPRPGAKPVMRKKVPVKKQKPVKIKKEKSGGGSKWVYFMIIPLILIGAAGGFLYTTEQNFDFATFSLVKKGIVIESEESDEVTDEMSDESVENTSEEMTEEMSNETMEVTDETSEEMDSNDSEEANWENEAADSEDVTESEDEEVVEAEDNMEESEEDDSEMTTEEEESDDDAESTDSEETMDADDTEEEVIEEELNWFESIIKWFKDLFASIFGSDEADVDVVEEDLEQAKENGWAEEEEEPVEEEPVEEEPEVVEEKPASSGEKTISTRTNRYYVIAGAFENPENAQNYRAELESQGYDSKVLVPRGVKNVHRVTIADFSTQREGILRSQSENDKFGFALWVLKY